MQEGASAAITIVTAHVPRQNHDTAPAPQNLTAGLLRSRLRGMKRLSRIQYTVSTDHNAVRRNRSALLTTDTELKLMASAANIGDNTIPNHGYSTPAATGTPTAL